MNASTKLSHRDAVLGRQATAKKTAGARATHTWLMRIWSDLRSGGQGQQRSVRPSGSEGSRAEVYIPHPHVPSRARTRRPLGRPAAPAPGAVERGGRARWLDHRERHLPPPRRYRATDRRRPTVPARLGGRRRRRAVRGAHLCRTRGPVSALGGHLRLNPRGIRIAPRVLVRLGGAVAHPPRPPTPLTQSIPSLFLLPSP